MNKSESISKLAAALVKAQTEMGNAVKDSKNPFYKSSYADLNSIREAVLPALNKNGISVLQPTVTKPDGEYVETFLLHESGEWISGDTKILLGTKANDPQAQGSGISYARRYGLQSMMNVGSVDDDAQSLVNTKPATLAAKESPAPQAKAESKEEPKAEAKEEKPKTTSSFRKPKPEATKAAPAADSDWK